MTAKGFRGGREIVIGVLDEDGVDVVEVVMVGGRRDCAWETREASLEYRE